MEIKCIFTVFKCLYFDCDFKYPNMVRFNFISTWSNKLFKYVLWDNHTTFELFDDEFTIITSFIPKLI